jgi:hypothetical protein
LLAVSAPAAHSQSQVSPIEVGAQFSTLQMTRFPTSEAEPGLGARFSWNFYPHLSLDSEFTIYPNNYQPSSATDGGRIFYLFTGVKARVIRRPKFSVSGKIRPGLMSYGDVSVQTSPTTVIQRRVTHFATNLGGVIECPLSPRWILRADVGLILVNMHSHEVQAGPGGFIIAAGQVRPAFEFSTGFSRRFGELRDLEKEPAASEDRRWELAGQFVTQSRQRETADSDVTTEPGLGARVSYDLMPHLTTEATLTFFPGSQSPITILDGGRGVQALFGVKSGVRFGRFGYFLRLRPGFESFTRTISAFDPSAPVPVTTGSKTNPALDAGGGMEFHATGRIVVRFDAGDTVLFLGSRTFTESGNPVTVPGGTRHTLQIATSFGWRF